MKSGETSTNYILFDITDDWRENLGGQGENREYKDQYMDLLRELGGSHLKARLKKASIECDDAEVVIEKRLEEDKIAYFLRIKIKPELEEARAKAAIPVLNKIYTESISLLKDFKQKISDEAKSQRPSSKRK